MRLLLIAILCFTPILSAQSFPVQPGGGGGSGTVTSLTVAGTANEIAAAGTCTITASGTCTFSFPSLVNFPGGVNWAAPSTPTFNPGGTTTVDWSASNLAIVTGSGTTGTTVAFTNPHGSGPYVLMVSNPATALTWAMPTTTPAACSPITISTTTIQIFYYDGSIYHAAPCSSSELGASRSAEVTAKTSKAGTGVSWFDGTGHLLCANNNASGTNSCTVPMGAQNDVVTYSFAGYPQDSGTLVSSLAPTSETINTTSPLAGGGNLSATRTFTCSTCATTTNGGPLSGVGNVAVSVNGAISYSNAIFPAFAWPSATADQLTSNGSNQFFSMNSGVNFPPADLTAGREFLLRFKVSQTVGAANTNTTLNPALCAGASGAGCVALSNYSAAQICVASFTCNWEIAADCIVTATPGTIACGAGASAYWNGANGQTRGNTSSGIITGIATTGNLYPNMIYNQATETGSTASLIGASGYFQN